MIALPQDSEPFFFYSKESPLSNHFARRFVVKDLTFYHMEGFIMFCKAMYFGDKVTAEKILLAIPPQAAKILGREVQGFVEEAWRPRAWEYAFHGNVAKFGQHRDLLSHLLSTGNRELVEASRFDRLWGIGLAADDPRIADRSLWGFNGQGKVLMRTRAHFS
jgi:ribA/ribD-fused uncharacterized protein